MRFKCYVIPWLLNSIMLFVFLCLVYVLIENETNRIRQLCERASVVLDLVTSYTADLKLLTNDLEVYVNLMQQHQLDYGDTALHSKGTSVTDFSHLNALP